MCNDIYDVLLCVGTNWGHRFTMYRGRAGLSNES